MFEKFKRILTILMLVEIGLLVLLGFLTAWWVPFAECFLAFVCGVFVAKHYGLSLRGDPQAQVSVLDATLGTFSAVLLMLPGMLTDLIGLVLWFGPTRRSLGKRAVKFTEVHSGFAFGPQGFATNEGGTIQAEVIDARTLPND